MRTACSTQFRLITGSMPGIAASTKRDLRCWARRRTRSRRRRTAWTWRVTWAWTSMPMTTSQSPVCAFDQLGRSLMHADLHPRHAMACASEMPAARFRLAARCTSPANSVASSNALPISCSPSGRPFAVKPAGTEMPGQPGQVHRHREDVVQIHRDRIGGLLADAEGRARRRRRQQHVALLERLVEIALDQRAHLLRPGVIGVVIAGRQHIGADQDAALHLRAEALGPGLLVQRR